MKRVLPLALTLPLTACVAPVSPDARLAIENAELRQHQALLVEHIIKLQNEIKSQQDTEEWLLAELKKQDPRRIF